MTFFHTFVILSKAWESRVFVIVILGFRLRVRYKKLGVLLWHSEIEKCGNVEHVRLRESARLVCICMCVEGGWGGRACERACVCVCARARVCGMRVCLFIPQ